MTSIWVNIWEEKGYKFCNVEKLGVIRCQQDDLSLAEGILK